MQDKIKKVSAIICSDIHLTMDTPICRTDNYIEAQITKLKFLSDLQNTYKCPVLHAGDLFNKWNTSPVLLVFSLKHLPSNIITIPGNHDLPQHNMAYIDRSGLGVLNYSNKITVIEDGNIQIENRKIRMFHEFIWLENKPVFVNKLSYCGSAPFVLQKHSDVDLVITGDNHATFIYEYAGRILVNPGSMMRRTADQAEHKPVCFLYYAYNNKLESVYFPIKENVISRVHLDDKEMTSHMLDAFIDELSDTSFIDLKYETFLDAIEQYITNNKNQINKNIEKILREACGA